MNIYLDVQSPAVKEAGKLASAYGLANHGLVNLRRAYWNLPTPALYEESIFRSEGSLSHLGPLVVNTGKHTARAAADKFVVREQSTEDKIWWGQYNRPVTSENFSALLARLQGYLQGRDVFVQDCYAGADPEYSLPVRIITQTAWHSLFARTMFLKVRGEDALRRHLPEFTVICAPSFKASPMVDGTRSETFIIVNFRERLAIIGGTSYAGEIKKTIFTVLNYLLPLQGVLSMHCSANVGNDGDVRNFLWAFGHRQNHTFRRPQAPPDWRRRARLERQRSVQLRRWLLCQGDPPFRLLPSRKFMPAPGSFGTILENVTFDPVSRRMDLNDDTVTENTRAAYPLDYIANHLPEKRAGHPQERHFPHLRCFRRDAAHLPAHPDQAIYHFISGYTSKIAGTEIGLGIEPQMTFSTCFGGPFMVHHPLAYAELLKKKIQKHGSNVWLVNTGWTGGPFGVGKRISIHHTRALLNAALSGSLLKVEFNKDPVFGFDVPVECEGVPSKILDPANTWPSRDEYFQKYDALAARFIENFKLMMAECPEHILEAGPKRLVIASVR